MKSVRNEQTVRSARESLPMCKWSLSSRRKTTQWTRRRTLCLRKGPNRGERWVKWELIRLAGKCPKTLSNSWKSSMLKGRDSNLRKREHAHNMDFNRWIQISPASTQMSYSRHSTREEWERRTCDLKKVGLLRMASSRTTLTISLSIQIVT